MLELCRQLGHPYISLYNRDARACAVKQSGC